MGLFKKKNNKKKANKGKFERIEVEGQKLPILNFYLFTSKEDSKRYIELMTIDEVPALHFSEVIMNVILSTKKLTLTTAFKDAYPKGRFKVYKFEVLNLNEYYI